MLNSLTLLLKEINWVRNVMWLLIFFIIILLLFAYLVRPTLMELKSKNIELRKEEFLLRQIEAESQRVSESRKKFMMDNKAILNAFENRFNEDEFLQSAKKFALSATIAPTKEIDQNSSIRQREYLVQIKVDTPVKFFDLLDYLSGSGYVLKSDFPIKFGSDEGVISVEFMLKQFYLAK